MLRFDKMTVKAQEAVEESQEIAARHENQSIEPLHLLVALVEQKDGVVPPLLARLGIRNELLMQDVNREIGRLPKVQGFGQHNMSRALNDVLERSFDEAEKFKDEYVSTEHIFLAIAGKDRDPAGQLLKKHGATQEAILQALTGIRGTQRVTSQNPESTYASLEKYARDLTDLARKSKLDPVIGLHAKQHRGLAAGQGMRRLRDQFDIDIFGVLRRQVRSELGGLRLKLAARGHQRIDGQLRCPAFRIEIAQDAIHTRLGKAHVQAEACVGLQLRVRMREEAQVLAHDEEVIKFLVDDFEIAHRRVRLGIFDAESEPYILAWLDRRRLGCNLHRIFLRIGDAGYQFHAAPWANARRFRAHIAIHRTHEPDTGTLKSRQVEFRPGIGRPLRPGVLRGGRVRQRDQQRAQQGRAKKRKNANHDAPLSLRPTQLGTIRVRKFTACKMSRSKRPATYHEA